MGRETNGVNRETTLKDEPTDADISFVNLVSTAPRSLSDCGKISIVPVDKPIVS